MMSTVDVCFYCTGSGHDECCGPCWKCHGTGIDWQEDYDLEDEEEDFDYEKQGGAGQEGT